MINTLINELRFTTTLKKVFIFSCIVGIYSVIPLIDYKYFNQSLNGSLTNLEAVFGIVIGLVLLFRANRAYERWWEARSLWGNLIGFSRNLAIKIKSIVNLDVSQLKEVSHFIICFAYTLKEQLQDNQDNINKPHHFDVTAVQLVNHFYVSIKNWQKNNLLTTQEFC